MLRADQEEIRNILEQIDRIASSTQYGHNNLLDGSRSGNGVATGNHLEFLSAGTEAHSSKPGGYGIVIQRAASRAIHSGSVALNQAIIDSGEQITISEGGRTVNFKTKKGTSVEQTLNDISVAIKNAGLDIDVIRPYPPQSQAHTPQILTFRHKEFGKEHTFEVASNTPGLVSFRSNVPHLVQNGVDIVGEIGGEQTTGRLSLIHI